MKKAVVDILGIVSVLFLSFGTPLFIVNVAREGPRKWIYLGMAVAGLLLLGILTLLRLRQKKK